VFWKENLINWFYSESDKFFVPEKFNWLNNYFNRLKFWQILKQFAYIKERHVFWHTKIILRKHC